MTPLAIVGIGSLFPQAADTGTFWTNIKKGVDAITEVPETHWRSDEYFDSDPKAADKVYAKHGGFLSPIDFNPMEYGILPNALEAIDTSQLLGLVAVDQALRDAGYGVEKDYDRDRVSVILGITGTLELVLPLGARLGFPRWRDALKDAGIADAIAEDVMRRISDSYVPWQENSFPGLLGNVVAGRISKHFDFGGTNCVVDAACGSSLSALNLAALELAAGRSDMVVTGGIDTFNDIFMYTCFSKTPALSPSGHARSFSADADGTTLGEGLGIIVMKRLADAERDGDRIYAVLKSIGTSSDGRGAAIYEPSAAGQKKSLMRAYQQAGVSPESIELVEGHGTGTKVGDAVEISALREVFGSADRPWCALGSIKSQIGHTKAAAGAAGLIKAALALYYKTLPPTIKVTKPQAAVVSAQTPFYINTEARPWIPRADHPRRAAVSALGFGGSNFHCLLEEYQPQKTVVDWQGDVQLAIFSAPDETQLGQMLEDFPAAADWAVVRLAAAQSRKKFAPNQTCRLALVIGREKTKRSAQLKTVLSLLSKNAGQNSWSTPDGSFFARGESAGNLAMLFPGQGAQYPGMLRDLAIQFPQFLNVLQVADKTLADRMGGQLSGLIYPQPTFDEQAQSVVESHLRQTENAQPALGAVSLGARAVLAGFGISADAYAGHSYGELTALCAGGVVDRPTLFELSRLRGELMAAGQGDLGSMLAVSAPLSRIETVLAEEQLDLVLANRNTPEQGVLSGATGEIEKAASILERRGLRFKQLAVSAAFHSTLVAGASEPFAVALADKLFAKATASVYSNTTGKIYPAAEKNAKDLLAEQLAKPVDFVAEIENMYRAGIRTFVEVGPGARMTGMVKAILGEREHHAFAIDSSNGRRSGIHDLARVLAQLATLGYNVKLDLWDEGYLTGVEQTPDKKPGMTVAICGANYFKPPAKRPPVKEQIAATAVVPAVSHEQKSPPETASQPSLQAPGIPASTPVLQDALRMTQQSLQTLQSLQEQTARLHQQFLEGQQAATQSFFKLVEQQRQLVQGVPTSNIPLPTATTTAIAPSQEPVVTPAPAEAKITAPVAEVTASAAHFSDGKVADVLLEVIAEKTGYPVEMLELEMALDTDLGIDSIKRVEILSALQEKLPEAPAVKPEDLGVLQTLGQIVDHLNAGMPATGTTPENSAVTTTALDGQKVSSVLLDVIAEKTGYPVEMLELEMALDTDLGIDSIKRVEILSALQERLPDAPAVKPEDLGVLQTLGQIVDHLNAGVLNNQSISMAATTETAGHADNSRIAPILLEVIAEKTGYPVEMLELEMALDTDLGIDSIKRVEILSALQERLPDAPAVKPEDLAVLQTLGQIVAHLSAGDRQAVSASAPMVPQLGQVDRATVATTLLDVIAEKTGYPVEMLELEMALDTDLGVDSIKRVEILSALQERLPGAPAIKPEHLGTLQTVAQIVDFLASVAAPTTVSTSAASAETATGIGIDRQVLKLVPLPIGFERSRFELIPGSEIWVAGEQSGLADRICQEFAKRGLNAHQVNLTEIDSLVPPQNLAGLIILSPVSGADHQFLKNSFRLLQLVEPVLNAGAEKQPALLATISRVSGGFGVIATEKIADPLSGGLAGLCKTAAHEWSKVHCKALDLTPDLEITDTLVESIVQELFTDGPREVGISAKGLQTLKLSASPVTSDGLSVPVAKDDLVIISGGARGVTAQVALALAEASQATLLLLGRSPLPDSEPDWLQGLTTETEIKQAVIANAATPFKPKDVAQRYLQISGQREVRENVARIEAAGSRVIYRSVDLRQSAAVAAVIDETRQLYGPVKGLIHGAGVLADRLIKDQTLEQFESVYATKVEGLDHLLSAVADDPLNFMVMFSSSTGRFGRTGQVAYAVANEVLNKIAQQQAQLRPDCRVLSLNWGPWDGGMVTPELKKVFAREGIAVIDLRAGAEYLVEEISTPAGGPVELVVLGGGEEIQSETAGQPPQNIYISKAFDLDLSVAQYPFLKSHVLDGKAVLPMAVIIEWMAHGAIHNNPGLRFHGFNDMRVLKGVILEPGQSNNLQVMTGKAIKSDGVHVVPVALSGMTASGQQFVHARAKIVLAAKLPVGKAPLEPLELPAYARSIEEVYMSDRLFHGTDFQAIREVLGCSDAGISALVRPAPQPTEWIQQPLRNSWLADPLAIDSSFQLMILWSFERYGAGSLPVFVDRYRQYRERYPENGVEIRVRVTEQNTQKASADIDFLDPLSGTLVARIEGYECVIDASLNASFQRNKLLGVA
ncbi:MAG: SDR family NAD(P)-dependent oxidoreductase [Desulfuromonadales bacterium]|nr:SDR family NAD(P)-dependent oxidoreductase [Desulfuromonadales bacterium]